MKPELDHIEALVVSAQQGDVDAFSEIYDSFLTPIYRFVFFRVSSEVEAEDITSEVFFKTWKNLKKYQVQEGASFSSWIFRIAHNEIIDFYRGKKEYIEISDEIEDEHPLWDGKKETERKIEHDRLRKVLDSLPKMQAEAIILKFFSERSNMEIAEILGKTETAIRILQSRGLKTLKTLFDE
ncbi:MAG: sigma-70 family RNA polymerase sigma factor [Candidatus Peregrinibacteria bacterium]